MSYEFIVSSLAIIALIVQIVILQDASRKQRAKIAGLEGFDDELTELQLIEEESQGRIASFIKERRELKDALKLVRDELAAEVDIYDPCETKNEAAYRADKDEMLDDIESLEEHLESGAMIIEDIRSYNEDLLQYVKELESKESETKNAQYSTRELLPFYAGLSC